MAMREALLAEIRERLRREGHDLGAPDLRAYLKQWTKANELDRFALDKPSRWRYFRHLFEMPRLYGEIMPARHRAYPRSVDSGTCFTEWQARGT